MRGCHKESWKHMPGSGVDNISQNVWPIGECRTKDGEEFLTLHMRWWMCEGCGLWWWEREGRNKTLPREKNGDFVWVIETAEKEAEWPLLRCAHTSGCWKWICISSRYWAPTTLNTSSLLFKTCFRARRQQCRPVTPATQQRGRWITSTGTAWVA